MRLLSLPNELFGLICDFLDDENCINALHQTCRRLHSFLGPTLYRHNAQSYEPCSLEWAAIHGFKTTARNALDAGILPTTACFEELVPIALACMHGHESIVRLMLDKGVDPNSDHHHWINSGGCQHWSKNGYPTISLMAYAARGGHLSVCKTLLEYEADPQTNARWNGAKTLLLAGEEGHLPVVKLLVELVHDDPGYEKAAYGCFNYAAKNGHFEVVRYLLEMGVRIDRRISYENALEFASRSGHLEIVQLLLSTCEVTTPQMQKTILEALVAAADEHHRALSDLLRSRLDTESIIVNRELKSPLIKKLFSIAAMCGWADLMQQLLELGCFPDMILERKLSGIRKYGWTALAITAKRGHLGVVEQLLNYNSNVNLPASHSSPGLSISGSRDFPIVLAATHGHMHIVEKLLQHSANPNPKTTRKKKRFAYDDVRSPEIMHLLLDWGADPSVKLKRGRSLLSDTLRTGSIAMVKMLLARKIPLEMPPEYVPDRELRNPRPPDMTQTARPVQRDTLFTLAAQNCAPMVEFLFEQGYKVEPGSNEVSMGFDSALSRADVPLVNLFLDRELLGDLVKSPYENLLGSIMSTRSDIEAAATIMDTLLAHGFEVRNDLQYHQRTEYFPGRSESAYANSDRNAIYQMLLDRGANPVAGPGPETELSIAAKNGDKRVVRMILKSLDRCGLAREDLQQKLAFAEEQAKLGFAEELIKDTDHPHIERALHRAYWRSVYPVPNEC